MSKRIPIPGTPAVHPFFSPSKDEEVTSPSESRSCTDWVLRYRGDSFPVPSKDRGAASISKSNVPVDGGVSDKKVSFTVPTDDEKFHDCHQSSPLPKSFPPKTRSRARCALAQLGLVYLTSKTTLAAAFPSL